MPVELLRPIGVATVILLLASYVGDNRDRMKYLRASGYSLVTLALAIYVPYNIFTEESIVESLLSGIGVIIGICAVYIILKEESDLRNTTFMILSSSILLLLTYSIAPIQSYLIDSVANETARILDALGYEVEVVKNTGNTYIVFTETQLRTQIVLACTGIGSIAIFFGLSMSSFSLSITERIGLALFTSSIIYVLNIVRNVFIASAYGGQLLHIAPNLVSSLFERDGVWVSYYVADRIIAQVASAVFLGLFAIILLSRVDEDSKMLKEWVSVGKTIHKQLSIVEKYTSSD